MQFYLGIDGGGTATKICLADQDGKVVERFRAGALNKNGQSDIQAKAAVTEIFQILSKKGYFPEECAGAAVGAAGISNSEAGIFLRRTFQEEGFQGELEIYGDHETALAAAFSDCKGIILIAGTGSICYGINENGTEIRSGGYGHLIDDSGSAYAIGRDILSAIVRAYDGRDQETLLQKEVYKKLAINSIEEMIQFLYSSQRSKKDVAALAVLLEDAILAGDKKALEIEDRCVVSLEELFDAVWSKMPEAENIALAGSVLEQNKRIRGKLCQRLITRNPGFAIVTTKQDASEGALRLLFQRKGVRIE